MGEDTISGSKEAESKFVFMSKICVARGRRHYTHITDVVCKKVVPDGHKIMFRDTNSVNDWLTE
jgi:hypothetical protein